MDCVGGNSSICEPWLILPSLLDACTCKQSIFEARSPVNVSDVVLDINGYANSNGSIFILLMFFFIFILVATTYFPTALFYYLIKTLT